MSSILVAQLVISGMRTTFIRHGRIRVAASPSMIVARQIAGLEFFLKDLTSLVSRLEIVSKVLQPILIMRR